MKLYSMSGTCALSVHIALEWIGAPYQLVMMQHGDNRAPAYLAINPGGKVPAVQLDDGRVLTQAAAILTWLVDTYPDSDLGATSSRPLQRFALEEALAYLTSEAHVAFGPFFGPARYLDDETQFDALKGNSLQQVAERMAPLDAQLRDGAYLLGVRTVADAYLYVLTRWMDYLPGGVAPFANLARFRAAMERDSAVAGALTAQGLAPLGAG
jgi:glutathione S-transferase